MEVSCSHQPMATHGCQPTQLEYKAETQDIRYITEVGSGDYPTVNETILQQTELNRL